jgi:O-antigen ligase
MADVANANFFARAFDRARIAVVADWLVVGVAVTLPWSTSVSEIFTVLWLLALLPTLTLADLRRALAGWAGALPALLWLAAVVGMAWADVSLRERLAGLGGYNKLLAVPLLLAQFRRSERAMPVLYGFVASCTALLVVSWTLRIIWGLQGPDVAYFHGRLPGIPVRDYIAQSSEFLVCTFGLLAIALTMLWARRLWPAIAFAALALLFLANVLYISTGRSALVVAPILFVLLGARYFGWKGVIGTALAGVMIAGIAWASSPFLRLRLSYTLVEIGTYRADNAITSAGLRLEFWKKSMGFVAAAPLLGNGTGSMPALYRRAAAGESGAEGVATVNPHNQYLAVMIELGLVGFAILLAMWVAHLALFRGTGLVAWFGLTMVLQNVISSAFNSHLFDSFHGWFYVFGVGVLGGMILRRAATARVDGA